MAVPIAAPNIIPNDTPKEIYLLSTVPSYALR